jgi:hypothetical protein
MSIRSEIDETLQELEQDCVGVDGNQQYLILASGKSIPCVPSMEGVGTIIAIGPQEEVITATVIVRRSWFITADTTLITADSDVVLADNSTARPRSGKTTEFRSKTYRVIKVDEDPSQAYLKVYLGSAR